MRKAGQGWTSCLLVRWALFRLGLRADGIVRTRASARHAIVLERPARQQAKSFLVPGSGKDYQHQAAGPNERVACEASAGLVARVGETARLAQGTALRQSGTDDRKYGYGGCSS